MAYNDIITWLTRTVASLETPQIFGIFIGLAAITFYIIHRLGKEHLEQDIHKLVNLGISVLIALILIGISTGIGFL